jgi:hypothetical protein
LSSSSNLNDELFEIEFLARRVAAVASIKRLGNYLAIEAFDLDLDLKTTAHTPQLAAIGISSPPTVRSAL